MSAAERLLHAARALLPADVGCAVVPIGEGRLLAEEAQALARAVPRRQAEFATGRLALRRAISEAGFDLPEDRPILPRSDRRPDLPDGLAVSLAHAGDLCIALASTRPGLLLGLDIESMDAPRPEGFVDTIQPFRFRGAGDALAAFCAKEALYKRQYPVTGRMLEFSDLALVLSTDGRFRACVAGVGSMQGQWLEVSGYYLAISIGSVATAERWPWGQ
ncbi:4-phosphopantetheinyl transferase [uncultured Paracoccus sp.]|uniref:4'-phosphopantetheinyl transferase family protein n=1 Tax=uncultured Paracoccus sp. TaxID=189685 RepID=UPI0026349E93|nr:4-phosphopantetheinyl transferase [uncultured Paracoccus sp.]